MKKFLFVALLGGSLIACNDTTTTMTHEDSVRYNDSVANAGSTTPTMNDTSSSNMMSDTSSSNMMTDTSSTMMSADSTQR